MEEKIVYEILLDFGSFENFLLYSVNCCAPVFFSLLGLKIGLGFIRDSVN